jgi:uncharacterized membrane protein (DUF2068 family)
LKRPTIISIICVIGYLSVVFTFPQIFSPAIKKLGVFVPAIFGILVAIHFIACVGIWYFKKWGVQLFLISFFCKILFYLFIHDVGISFYINTTLSLAMIVVLLRFYPKMNANL